MLEKKHRKRVIFQGKARTVQTVFRVSKQQKSRVFFFLANEKYEIRVCFLLNINTRLGYNFEPISLIRVRYFAEFENS